MTTTASVNFWGKLNKENLAKLKDVKVTPLKKVQSKNTLIDYFEEEDEEFDTVSLGNLDEQDYDLAEFYNKEEDFTK